MTDKEIIKTLIKVELARRDGGFYYYCQLMVPKFYTAEKTYLKYLCDTLERFIKDPSKKYLLLSCPPRFGKSLTISLLCSFLLGKDKNLKIMTGSYNEDFATMLSKQVRNRLQEEKIEPDKIIHNDIFQSEIEKGSAKANQFKIKDSEGTISMLATSPGGSATGYPASIIVLDDLIKSASEAYSPKRKDELYNNFFKNTLLSRLEGETRKVIIVNTRWATDDISGRLLMDKVDEPDSVVEVDLKCMNEHGELLCESIINREQYEELKKMLSEDIFEANYNGRCIDIKDKMYSGFNTYNNTIFATDDDIDKTFAICDVAGTGSDSTCVIIASTSKSDKNKIFVREVYFTNDSKENQIEKIAKRLTKLKVEHFRYESNGAGQYFGQSLQVELDKLKNDFTVIKSFHQSANKESKIFAQRKNVENFIYFPETWGEAYPKFFNELVGMKTAHGSNEHDDAADGVSELVLMAIAFGYIRLELPKQNENIDDLDYDD